MTPFEVMAALREAMARLQSAGTEPWPGFDPGTVPVAIYDGTATFLFGHPAPPGGFQPAAPFSAFPGLHPAVRANSVALIGDVLTATVMLPSIDTSVAATAAVVAHEAFHVFQYQHHPGWGADESHALTYPVTSVPLHHLLLLEMEALEQALAAGDAADRGAAWAHLALALRRQRYAILSPGAAAYERSVERLEGLAHYVEMQFAASARRPLRFGPEDVRRRSYAVGLTHATLLDRFAPAWKAQLTQNDTLYLDELLAKALPSAQPPAAAVPEETSADLQARAEREAGEVAARREAMRSAFITRAGWRLEVVASPEAPLRPRGFDPMNLHLLTPSEVLHTRWVRLGSGDDTIEVFGEVLTVAAGAHPLFAGVARLTVAGLAEAPRAVQNAGALTVTADGVAATFRHATATQTDRTTIITIG